MPVYTEVATSQRELRVQPSYAPPLPDLKSDARVLEALDKYDVIVVGAGPCGLLASLLLSRYGIPDTRLLCIDSKPGTLRSGQADGLQPRTLEVLQSLGLHHEIIDQGCLFWEISFWDADHAGGIKRTSHGADVDVASQFPHEVTIHQGRIERILDDDLKRYSERGVERSAHLLSARLDEAEDAEYPVVIDVEKEQTPVLNQSLSTGRHTLRCKHLIGADGAHSAVRRAMGMQLVGESKEHIWGVMDLVCKTTFPDVRRKSMVQSAAGSCMVIPRERIATGDYLTRIYVHMDETFSEEAAPENMSLEEAKQIAREKRSQVTAERILAKANEVLQPYGIKMKEGTVPDWWAAYEIGQRMCDTFIQQDSRGMPRVFLAGDSCHTHSPKAGQGMNVSMMDAYNLAWKLAHVLQGITPDEQASELLESYGFERCTIARELISFDEALSTAFSSKNTGDETPASKLSKQQLNDIWKAGHGFSSGCGIEYRGSRLVEQDSSDLVGGDDYLAGVVRPGRRLMNVHVLRHTDGKPTNLHEELPSTGRFRLLLFASTDLLSPNGRSAQAAAHMPHLLEKYPLSLLQTVVLHPLEDIRGIDWIKVPPEIYQLAEMSFYSAFPDQTPFGKEGSRWSSQRRTDDAYAMYGLSKEKGAFVVLRPDQVVGMVADLEHWSKVESYLDTWLLHYES